MSEERTDDDADDREFWSHFRKPTAEERRAILGRIRAWRAEREAARILKPRERP